MSLVWNLFEPSETNCCVKNPSISYLVMLSAKFILCKKPKKLICKFGRHINLTC